MSVCDLTGKKAAFGNTVSHSQRKTRRKFMANMQSKTFVSSALQSKIRLSVSSSAIKTIDKSGGLDEYLIKASSDVLSTKAKALKNKIKDKIAAL